VRHCIVSFPPGLLNHMMDERKGYQIIVLVINALDFGLAPAGEPVVDMFALAVVGEFVDAAIPRALDDG